MTTSHTKQEIEMRKFNLEEAKAGKAVVTRTGRPVRILCFDAKGSDPIVDRKSTRLNSSHSQQSRMPSSA